MRRCAELITRFGRDESGVFAVVFGVMAIVLIAFGGAAVDYVSMEQVRNRSQIALDAAALALQPDIFDSNISDENIRKRAEDLMIERIGDDRVTATLDPVRIDRLGGSLQLSARIVTPTLFVSLVGVNSLSASVTSEAVRGSLDLEISVALDVTGSMSGTKIQDLRNSVVELIDAVVQDVQDPNSSRMALVPYSQAVNAGDAYATALRGPIRGPKPIRTIAWSTGATKAITAATQTNTPTITANGHGFSNNDWVYIWGVTGMKQINDLAFQVTSVTTNTFRLKDIDGTKYNKYTKNGSVVKCLNAECALTVTADNHGYNTGEYVHVTDVKGLTAVNNRSFLATKINNNTLRLNGTYSGTLGTYTSGGDLHCTWQNTSEGCSYYRFATAGGGWNTLPATTCVTERAINGTNDEPPTTTLVGRNYPPLNNSCLDNAIVPLTHDKDALKRVARNLSAVGTTSGSLGALWAWYMLSPNFGYVWPFDNRPEQYDTPEVLKVAIIMTDGEFNTVHCEGVISRNSSASSTTERNNCNAPNGAPYVQARAYCDAMKAENIGIVVYTVAFDIAANSEASRVMTYCASDVDKAFKASDGAALRESFRQIARNLSVLRLAR